ncbi:MAG: TonB-dependent receptor [Casimicrobium sp.]
MIKKKQLVVAIAATFVASGVAYAQQTTQRVEKIEITGSNIKRVDTETASPVQIITREDIERSGAQTVSDLLQKIPSNNGGAFNESSLNSFAAGSSAVSLRGLGPQATLILLNGRRLTNYGFAVGAQTVFVDLNTIPLEAVDRVEILKDGASAIYGSEAMAGVVNIILRSDFKGGIVKAGLGTSQESDASVYRASVAYGVGDIAKDRWNAFGTLEYYKRDPLFTRDRSYTASSDLRPLGGSDLRTVNAYPGNYDRLSTSTIGWTGGNTSPGFTVRTPVAGCKTLNTTAAGGVCVLEPNDYLSTVPKTERYNAFGKVTFALNESTTLFGEAGYIQGKTRVESTPAFPTSWLRATDYSLQTISLPGNAAMVLPVGHPSNPYSTPVILRYTFVDLGPRTSNLTSDVYRLVGGVKGSVGAWDYEAGLLHTKSSTENVRTGFVQASALRDAIARGTYLFGGTNSASVLSSISPNLYRSGSTSMSIADVKVSNPDAIKLPFGSIGVAAGLEHRREDMQDTPDPLYANGDIMGLGATTASGKRNVTSAYVEATAQILKTLEAQAAVRTDRYNDYGNSTTPKFGLKWTPIKEILLRGTYAKGFRAPSLPEISKSSVTGFFNNQTDPQRCEATGLPADCNFSIPAVIGPNAKLVPETANSFTVGVVLEPTKNLSLAVDYYEIKRVNEIGSLDLAFLLDNESRFPGLVFRNPTGADGLPGTIKYVNLQYINTARTLTKGLDFDVKWNTSLPDGLGKLSGNVAVTSVLTYKNASTPTEEYEEYNGSHNQPRNRVSASAVWERGPWSTGLNVNYTSSFTYSGSSNGACAATAKALKNCVIGSWTTFGLNGKYTGFKNLEITGGVDNLLNRRAPLDSRNSELYNYNYHSIVGRYFSAGLKYTFR